MNLDYENFLKVEIEKFKFDEDNLNKFFFKDFNCIFSEKKINFISGKNGIGKSTFFNILQNKINTKFFIKGSLFLQKKIYDISLQKDINFISEITGLVAQNYDSMLADNFTVLENLKASSLEKYPNLNFFEKENFKNLEILNEAGIALNSEVKNLSGGQKQILAITMILQKNLKIILLDEPTAALDDLNSDFVFKFIKKIIEKRKIFFICISHDKEIIQKYCDKSYYEIIKNSNSERLILKRS